MTINNWIDGLPEAAVDSEPANTSHIGYWIYGAPYVSPQSVTLSLLGKITIQTKASTNTSFAPLVLKGRITEQISIKIGPSIPAILRGRITTQAKIKGLIAPKVALSGLITAQAKLKGIFARVAPLKGRIAIAIKGRLTGAMRNALMRGKIVVAVKQKGFFANLNVTIAGRIAAMVKSRNIIAYSCDLVLFGAITPDIPLTAPITGGDAPLIGLLSGGDVTMQAIMCCDD